MNDIISLISHPQFCELRNRPRPVYGDPQGPAMQRPVLRWIPCYEIAWKVAEGYCRWAHAETLAELPAKVAAKQWE